MKKGYLIMMGLMAIGAVQANQCGQCTSVKTEVQTSLTKDEQTFAAKLGEAQRTTFNQMSAEQRKAVLSVASKDAALTADAAVEKVSKETASVTTEVKVTEKK